MAPDPTTQERIYAAIKRDLLDGVFGTVERIDIRALSDRHRSSATPVREVLCRLVGERLVENRPEGGFRMAMPDWRMLVDMYSCHNHFLAAALSLSDPVKLRQILGAYRATTIKRDSRDVARVTANLFNSLAWTSGNSELMAVVQNLNERLHPIRIRECDVFSRPSQDLHAITRNGLAELRGTVSRRISRYHRLRIDKARLLLGAIS